MTTVLRDLYQTITGSIVAALEAGTPPWIRPWTGDADPRPAKTATCVRVSNASPRRPRTG